MNADQIVALHKLRQDMERELEVANNKYVAYERAEAQLEGFNRTMAALDIRASLLKMRESIKRELEEADEEYVAWFRRLLAVLDSTLPAGSTVLGAPDEHREGPEELKG